MDTSPPGRAVVVFTRDLRVRDHPALATAARAAAIVPLFVFDDAIMRRFARAANRLQFLLGALADLDASLRERGGALVVRRGTWVDEVEAIAGESSARTIHLSADASGYAQRRVAALRARVEPAVSVVEHPGIAVVDPGQVETTSGRAFQVFTPYHRRWTQARWRSVVAPPRDLTLVDGFDPGALPSLSSLTDRDPSPNVVIGGERAALTHLRTWSRSRLAHYDEARDRVADDHTSHISAALHFGCLSPLEVATRLRGREGGAGFVRQLAWRDFFLQLLAERPEAVTTDLRPRGAPTGRPDAAFAAWCAGRTGYPIVDAGMRQLRDEGYLPNRVRMIVASFLTKDLDVPWQLGAAHFLELLVDGDLASNQLNWQWVAGTGTDTNPHRIFNPIRQSERFDPDGRYIRRFVTELHGMAAPEIHDPPPDLRRGVGYPDRVVEHADAIGAYRARISGPATLR